MKRLVVMALLGVLAVGALLAAGCGGDEKEPSTPTPSGPADLTPRVGGVDAMRRYLFDDGLDGRKGELTDPINCAEVPQDSADQEYCIIDDASTYAAGLVILYVARVDSRNDDKPDEFKDIWEVHLEPGEAAWSITDVEEVPAP